MRAARSFLVVTVVLLLAGCGQSRLHRSTLKLTEKDSGKTFIVKLHQAIVFKLASSTSAGYGWFKYLGGGTGPDGFRFVSRRYVRPKSPGAAWEEIFRYRAVTKGTHEVDFLAGGPLRRPGRHHEFTFQIR
jgi:hypothetical protein